MRGRKIFHEKGVFWSIFNKERIRWKQPLRAGNFNLSHTMLIQRRAHRRSEGWFAKVVLQIIPPTSHEFCTSPLPPLMSLPSDQHRVAPIEVSLHGGVSFHLICFHWGNVPGGNQPLCANYGNFNLSHTMLIQRRAHRRWEGWFAKVSLQITPPTSHEFYTSPLPPLMNLPLDQYRVALIEVSIVCTEGLVSTWYVPQGNRWFWEIGNV
jgi:hypothetical protein